MTDMSASVFTRSSGWRAVLTHPLRQWGARYKTLPELQVIAHETGGMLLMLRPLIAMRLNAVGVALMSALSASEGRTADELAACVPELSPLDAAAFLDALARRRLLVREPPTLSYWPSVAIIVAAHGRPAATRACVESLLSLDYPSELIKIVVVDDATDPPLAPALIGLPIQQARLEKNVGQSAARNLAAAEADDDLLAFIDNDCTAAPGWLRDLVPYFDDPEIVIVGGRVVAPPPTGSLAAFEAVRSPLDMGSVSGVVGPREAVAYLPTCNLIVRRDVLLAVEGFDAGMRVGEDVDFVWRVLRSNALGAHYVAGGEIIHDHRVRLGALLRRRADYGSSEADLQCRHPEHEPIIHVPRAVLITLAALALGTVFWPASATLALLAFAMILLEVAAKHRRVYGMGIDVPTGRIAASVFREHAASLYHFGGHVTRYYELPLVAICFLWPPLLPVAAVLMLVTPVWDHYRLKPLLILPAFVGLYWLEMAAYQLGVWRGCLDRRCWRPLLPRIRWRP